MLIYVPSRSRISSEQGYLNENKANSKTYGERTFSICAPELWNILPKDVRDKDSVESLKQSLKTHYFKCAFKNANHTCDCWCLRCVLYVFIFYLNIHILVTVISYFKYLCLYVNCLYFSYSH